MSALTSLTGGGALTPQAGGGGGSGPATSGAGNITVNAGGPSTQMLLIIGAVVLAGLLIFGLFRGHN